MTEDVLDKLRQHAERLADEAHRFQRSLKGSSASEDTAREHLGNIESAAAACRRDGLALPVVKPAALVVPVVTDATERAVVRPPEVRMSKPAGRAKS